MAKYLRHIILGLIVLCFACIALGFEDPHAPTSSNQPRINLYMKLYTNNTADVYRGEILEVSYSMRAENNSNVEVEEGIINIPPELEIIGVSEGRYIFERDYSRLKFNKHVRRNSVENCSFNAKISLKAKTGLFDLTNATLNLNEWRGNQIELFNIEDQIILNIKNNEPQVQSANVVVPKTMEDSCLACRSILIYKNIGPISLDFKVNASDYEGETLYYNWSLKNSIENSTQIDTLLENETNYVFFNKSLPQDSHNINISDLDPGMEYSFFLSVTDLINHTVEIPVKITYKGDGNYSGIYIPKSYPKISIILYIFIIILLCIIGVNRDYLYKIYNKFLLKPLNLEGSSYADEVVLVLITSLITLVYIYSNKYLPQIGLVQGSYKLVVYLKSLSLFEIYVYLVVFVAVVYFTEACFGQEFKPNSKKARTGLLSGVVNSINLVTVSKLWIINSIFMLILLLSLDAIILRVNQLDVQDWLMNYYAEMGEIFATILAIIAAFYTAIPKNIISPRGRGAGQQDKPYRYLHTKILHYFLVLYGVIVALSIWGFSVGLTTEFPALVELSMANLFNLVSIAVFEMTLLLVPPAISCLYELLRSMLFTGNVKIMSRPCGAKIYVDRTETRLLTPSVLMLPKGLHKISLKKDRYEDFEVVGEGKEGEVCVNAGTEQEYECRLKSKRRRRRET